MIIPNFANFRGGQTILVHSAKGSTWENHKYIKRVDGTYYYPNDYKGGRHISTLNGGGDSEDTKVFDEFEQYSKDLEKKGQAYWGDSDDVFKMSREELADLYEDMTGVKLGKDDLERLYRSTQAAKNKRASAEPEEEWEKTFYNAVDLVNKKNPGSYDPKQNFTNIEDFRKTLNSFGVDSKNLSEADLYRMYDKVNRHYTPDKSDQTEEIEDWERTLYDDIEKTLENNPGLFDPADIVDLQDFELTLAEFAGVDTEGMDPAEIERMRQKVIDHYADEQAARTLNDDDIYNLANEVIKGNFGNGAQRRELLGSNFQEVQDKVNEILRSQGSKPISSEKEEPEQKKEETKKPATSSSTAKKGLNMEQVMDVYRRNQKTAKEDEDKKNRRTSVRNRTRR